MALQLQEMDKQAPPAYNPSPLDYNQPGKPDYQPGYGQPNQPGYGQPNQPGYGQPNQLAIVGGNQPAAVPIIQVRPSNYLALAIFTCICWNPLFGITAIVFSVLSSLEADKGNMEKARTRGKISCAGSIIGIITGVIAVIAIVVYNVVVVNAAVSRRIVSTNDGVIHIE